MCCQLPLEKNSIAVGELPKIEGAFGCAVPAYHATFANGVFHGMDFGDKSGAVTNGPDRNGVVYGYSINFGNNQRHNNVSPCLAVYLWERKA